VEGDDDDATERELEGVREKCVIDAVDEGE
jgi:hypothetical protein